MVIGEADIFEAGAERFAAFLQQNVAFCPIVHACGNEPFSCNAAGLDGNVQPFSLRESAKKQNVIILVFAVLKAFRHNGMRNHAPFAPVGRRAVSSDVVMKPRVRWKGDAAREHWHIVSTGRLANSLRQTERIGEVVGAGDAHDGGIRFCAEFWQRVIPGHGLDAKGAFIRVARPALT